MLLRRPIAIAARTMMGIMWVLSVLMWSNGAALAQTGGLSHSPAEIVKKYFELDQKGAKLDSMSFEALAPYRSWQAEPVWGKVVVIRGFSVPVHHRDWEIVNRLEVVIPVTFQVIGSVYLETAGFLPDDTVEEIRVRVKSIRNRWRIIEPMLPPHVGQKRMINYRAGSLGEGNGTGQAREPGRASGRIAKGQVGRTMGKAPIDLFIFDLDGTLIESKWDIAASVNFTLEELGLPQRPIEEIFGFVGDGVKKLLRLAVGETNRISFEEALGVFRRHYLAHCLDRTVYYPGVEKTLGHFAGQTKGGRHEQVDRIHPRYPPRTGAAVFRLCRRRRQRIWIKTRTRHVAAYYGTAERCERADGAGRRQYKRHQRRAQCRHSSVCGRLRNGQS